MRFWPWTFLWPHNSQGFYFLWCFVDCASRRPPAVCKSRITLSEPGSEGTLVFLCRVPWLKFNIPTVADFHVLYSSHGHCNVVFSSSIESGRPSSPAKDKGEMNLRSRIILYIHRKVGWQISIFLLTASHKISRNGPYIPFNFEESFYPMNLFISSCSSFHLMPRNRFHSLSSR